MSFPRYERYTDAGSGWLGHVPAHWQVLPNKAYLRDSNKLVGEGSSAFTLLSLTLSGVIVRDVDSGKGKFPAEFDTYKAVEEGDLILCLFDIDETPRTVGLARQEGMITGAYEVLRCRPNAFPSFLYYFYLHVDAFKGLRPWYTGLRKVVRPDTFMSIKLALPPLDEQKAIGSFLDHETTKIDVLIGEQRRLIELLKEKRQAVVLHAVTKGLDSHAPTKDSGIAWLGRIPAHWNVVPMGYLVKFFSGGTPDKTNESFWDGTIPWVSPKDMKVAEIAESQDHVTEKALSQSGLRLFEPNHLLIVVRGMILAHTFPVARNVVPVTINQDMKALVCGEKLNSKYLHQFLNGLNNFIVSQADESAHGTLKLESEVLSHLPVPVPPVDEQLQISTWVLTQLKQLDGLNGQVDLAIQHLLERRSALISAAVTGKIDIRNYAPAESAVLEEAYEPA